MTTLPAAPVCFRPDGTISPDIPCGFSSSSQCCGEGWDCLSNGLCQQHGTTSYSQGSCTDPGYKGCLAFCNEDQFEGYTEVSRCDDDGNSWCCAGAGGQMFPPVDCCFGNLTTSLQPFSFATLDPSANSETEPKSKTVIISRTVLISLSLHGTPSFTYPKNPVSLLPATTSQLTSRSSAIASSSSVSSQSPSIGSSSPGSSRASATVSSSSVSSQGSIIAHSSPVPSKPLIPNHSLRIGIEIGVPLAVITILLVSLAFCIFRKQQTHKQDLVELEGRAAWELDHCHTDACRPIVPRYELG